MWIRGGKEVWGTPHAANDVKVPKTMDGASQLEAAAFVAESPWP